jgi:acetyl esterase/lipase
MRRIIHAIKEQFHHTRNFKNAIFIQKNRMMKNIFKSTTLTCTHFITIAFAVMTMIACKKNNDTTNTSIPPVPDSGVYISNQYDSAQIVITRDIAYSTRANTNGQYTSGNTLSTDTLLATLTMKLDVAVPPNATASAKQPLIVYIHGGNFLDGDKHDMESEMLTYAKAGYVAATVNYRLTANNEVDVSHRIQAIISAVEDVMNAIRYLKLHADTYHIDTSRIATIGSSAGGGISLINAVQFDDLFMTVSDFPGVSSKVQGAISTGATLVETGINPTDYLQFGSNDTPVLLFHANPEDGYRHTTWTGNVIPTQQLINNSGNECIISAQPDMTHTVNLSVGGAYWNVTKDFLWKKLKLYAL